MTLKSQKEAKQSNLKMSKESKQTLLQGRHTDSQETYEKILKVTNNQRDAN